MKFTKDRHGVYPLAFFLLTLCAVVLRTVALLIGYDTVTGYYTTPLGKCADVVAAVSVLFFLSYAVVFRKDKGHEISFFSPASYVPAGIVAASLPFFAKRLFSAAAGVQNVARTLPMRVTATIGALLTLPALLFFLLCILTPRARSVLRGECGILTALAFAVYAAFLYFNTSLPINSPGKLTEQCAYLLISVFFLYETRIALGRECRALYRAFGFAAAHLAAYSSLPSLILYFFRDLIASDSLPAVVLTFGLFLFISLRVRMAGHRDEATHTPLTDTLFALAAAREDEVFADGPLPYDILEAEKNDPKHLPSDIFADLTSEEEWEDGEEEPSDSAAADESMTTDRASADTDPTPDESEPTETEEETATDEENSRH